MEFINFNYKINYITNKKEIIMSSLSNQNLVEMKNIIAEISLKAAKIIMKNIKIFEEFISEDADSNKIFELTELEKTINGFTDQALVKARVAMTTFSVGKFMIVFDYDKSNKDLPFAFRPDMKSAKAAKDKLEKTGMFTDEMNLRIEKIKS